MIKTNSNTSIAASVNKLKTAPVQEQITAIHKRTGIATEVLARCTPRALEQFIILICSVGIDKSDEEFACWMNSESDKLCTSPKQFLARNRYNYSAFSIVYDFGNAIAFQYFGRYLQDYTLGCTGSLTMSPEGKALLDAQVKESGKTRAQYIELIMEEALEILPKLVLPSSTKWPNYFPETPRKNFSTSVGALTLFRFEKHFHAARETKSATCLGQFVEMFVRHKAGKLTPELESAFAQACSTEAQDEEPQYLEMDCGV